MKILPPDPERMNDDRAEWAAEAFRAFQVRTGADYDDVLPDLLTSLMHWCDRNDDVRFMEALARALRNYHEEISQ